MEEDTMFGKHYLFKLVAAIAVAASIAVVGARIAKAASPHGRSVASARHAKSVKPAGLRLITDTLGGSGKAAQLRGFGGGNGRAVA
jgi:hypothetical protein